MDLWCLIRHLRNDNLGIASWAAFVTILVARLFLWYYPEANVYLLSFNIHHFYIGALLVLLVSTWLLSHPPTRHHAIAVGVGAGLMLDQLAYLIATDGSDMAYLSMVSFNGAVLFLVLYLLYNLVLCHNFRKGGVVGHHWCTIGTADRRIRQITTARKPPRKKIQHPAQ